MNCVKNNHAIHMTNLYNCVKLLSPEHYLASSYSNTDDQFLQPQTNYSELSNETVYTWCEKFLSR